ncbi:MerR family transcriptional regulator [Pontixanthobacter aquaemixtae]|uniref:MerR family transcriptional regulator n=1 Tax=Pontixanthobacter aquaemixtae TaxID=1958940 RepID=A0A844ZZ51_9SPHN|nr:MerR family transcriptional regulator [Pontixanthobacter aquaemixtae]MXO90719.1 MerR family transcriptional regulator [Pontixanthobacter aquaemixtae]
MSAQFEDGKDEGALRTIGEVSKALDIKTHVLRYWEQQFPMLEPLKRSGGRRYYRPEDVELIEKIDKLVNRDGYTLKGAQQALEDGKGEDAPPPAPAAETEHSPAAAPAAAPAIDPAPIAPPAEPVVPAEVIAQLKGIRARLVAALDA